MWDSFQEGLVQVGVKERKEPYPLRINSSSDDDDYGEEEGEYGGEEED